MRDKVKNLIQKYAVVYQEFELLQASNNQILVGGDQKTGVIGEYYAKCYIESLGVKEVEYAKPGESFDLKYHSDEGTIKVQVKAVSAHSKTRTIAPLNLSETNGEKPFNFLYLISLDENFIPNGFYINTYAYLKGKANGKDRIQGSIMKGSSMKDIVIVEKKGSGIYDFTKNEIKTLLDAIK
jgi:hypothetical protein